MQYIRQWKVGDQTFDNKRDAVAYEAVRVLTEITGNTDIAQRLASRADDVMAALRPFATPRTRKPKTNGTSKRPGKAAQAHATT